MPVTATAPGCFPAADAEMPGDLAPGWPASQDADLADWGPGDADLADWGPGDADLADWGPGDADLADWEPGDADLADSDLEEPAVERPRAGGREVLKAGRWDRSCGDGGGFAAGGVADRLPPGPVLAGFADHAWVGGLGRLSDDELIGIMRAGRRLASWAGAMELKAVGELWQRRVAEDEAGDTGAACHADEEIAAALTLTARAADQALDLAIALGRLPLTSQALAAGDIDLPRATVIAREVTGLDDEHAAGVDRAIAVSASGKTTGQLAAATRQAVMAADPGAARRRKEHAQRDARVERWAEHAGTAALAGRDLPPTSVLAADQNLTALARQLKAAGVPGTMDTLRAHVFLALLTETPLSSLLPGDRPARRELVGTGRPATPVDRVDPGTAGSPGGPRLPTPPTAPAALITSHHLPGPGGTVNPAAGLCGAVYPTPGLSGAVNLTMPLATWLGLSDAPGNASGYGPLDASDSRDLARALANRAGNRWCLTFTDARGSPVAHGCVRAGPAHDGRHGDQPASRSRAGPRSRSRPGRAGDGWTFTITLLPGAACNHTWRTGAYQPSPALRHLVETRHGTCVFPGCRRPAAQCDEDHTVPYDQGGKTCLCNLAPLCRQHHRCKQAEGWRLAQPEPGMLVWQTPSGRTYTITPTPTVYPA